MPKSRYYSYSEHLLGHFAILFLHFPGISIIRVTSSVTNLTTSLPTSSAASTFNPTFPHFRNTTARGNILEHPVFRTLSPEELTGKPSQLTLRAFPELMGMAGQDHPMNIPLHNVRSIATGTLNGPVILAAMAETTGTSRTANPVSPSVRHLVDAEMHGNMPKAVPSPAAAGSQNYISVEANVPLSHASYQASPQSYMKRYPHTQYSTVELPPLLYTELKERADYSLRRVDQLLTRVEPELLKSGAHLKANSTGAFAAIHESLGRANTRAKQLSRSALIALDISKGLAQDYQLTREQIQYALPQISIYGTVLGDVCVLPPIPPCSCKPAKFREIDGFCNNPFHPEWGRAFSAFQRFLPAAYDDGIESPRARSVSGSPLPSARVVSTVMHPDVDRPHCHYTLLLMHFGQFMDHDINHTPSTTLTGFGKSANIQCCEVPWGIPGHPACFPIEIPFSDPFYSKYNLKCMNFVRSEAAPRPGCALGPREQLNQLTSFLDGSQIYGSTYEDMKQMRAFQFGRLRTVFVDYCHKDILPPDLETGDCPDANASLPCFRSGDSRVNENTGLATMHIIFSREHNRLAEELYYLNPHWDDERLFQEARRIVGAMLQHITYNEWLPLVLGKDVMYQNDLLPLPTGFYGGYDKNVNPNVANVFSTAALRFGHTLIPSWFRFFNKYHEYIGQKQLRDAFFKPYSLYQPGVVDMYLLGMINDNIQKRDTFITAEVTEHLFEFKPHQHGVDLAAVNVQRGRDHGLPSYNTWREFCSLPRAYTFDDLKDVMRVEVVERFKTVYESVDDIDLMLSIYPDEVPVSGTDPRQSKPDVGFFQVQLAWFCLTHSETFPAGVAEEPLHDGLLGPTFTCLLTKQFVHLKRGDRFWYENDIAPQAFTPEQLYELRRTSIARIICDNSDEVETIQPSAFLHVLPLVNERVPCKGPFLPRLNLQAWKEVPREAVDLRSAIQEAVQEVVLPRPPNHIDSYR